MNSAIILCGGSSTRLGVDKLLLRINATTVIEQVVARFSQAEFSQIIVVVNENNKLLIADALKHHTNIEFVCGGASRMQSVRNGLNKVNSTCEIVAIHDGARPYASLALINDCLAQARLMDNAIPSTISRDTVYYTNDSTNILDKDCTRILDRDRIKLVQTPQMFRFSQIMLAYEKADTIVTDDSQVYFNYYKKLNFVAGEVSNIKITFPSDISSNHIGIGSDFHQLIEGRKLILGGVSIPYHLGLLGHSDADVLVHAVMDSLLSAINERDIGVQFPDSDFRFKDADSMLLLKKVATLLEGKKATICNISAVIIAQQPKLRDYIPQMIINIANCLNINCSQISISATTTEKLGVVGEGRAMSAQAQCLINF